MKVMIIGSGRMGQRHASGLAKVSEIEKITLVDISQKALDFAKKDLSPASGKFDFQLLENLTDFEKYNVGILAATAQNRIQLCETLVNSDCKTVLVEKPLGQSLKEVELLIDFFKKKKVDAFVNLNMRTYPDSIKLKNDLDTLPNFKGVKNITINTGTVGIGANGIHYLDFIFFITNADDAKIVSAEIDNITIPSARGAQFSDFGGWCVIKFYKEKNLVANVFISISPTSTVFGGWDIVGAHGRITINESSGKRVDYIRRPDSEMPIQRYNADYEKPVEIDFDSPFLGDLTKMWLDGLLDNEKNILPRIEEALPSHKLMFEWLKHNNNFQEEFPIT